MLDLSYVGRPNPFTPTIEALRAELRARPDGTGFLFDAFYGLLTRLAAIEPAVDCEPERRAIRAVYAMAKGGGNSYTLPQLYATRLLARSMFKGLPIVDPSLDVGTGDGFTAECALDRPVSVGTDLFASALAVARKGPAARSLAAADMQALPFRDGAFNTVLSMYAVYHADDVGRAIREMVRVTAPGGTIAFTMPTADFAEARPLASMLEAAGLPNAAAASTASVLKHRPSLDDIRATLAGCDDIEAVPFLSLPLLRLVYFFYDLEVLFGFTGPEAREAYLVPFLDAVVAPLLARDAELSAEHGAGFWFVRARRAGALQSHPASGSIAASASASADKMASLRAR